MSETAKETDKDSESREKPLDFIRQIIADDIKSGKHQEIVTRFPPEPNGLLHIGHAKAICLSFGINEEIQQHKVGEKSFEQLNISQADSRCHLRFDDTNPAKEEQAYIDAIQNDIKWLGYDWGKHEYYASDYFEQLFEWAMHLIDSDLAYVDDQTPDEIRKNRGNLTEPGTNSPLRDRSKEESRELFQQMRDGAFKDGERVLRAKIDMAHPNINMRDPIIYRVLHATHPRTGDKWCIYPMYDYAHGQSDAIEHITHSLCSLEFEAHRPLYEWFLEQLPVPARPRQIEFARLNIASTVMSKRKLLELVNKNIVSGWDDPRMPTLSGLRRRGVPPESIKAFCVGVGIAKRENLIEQSRLDFHIRETLNKIAERRMVVLNPLKVVITNYPEDQVEMMDAINNPEDESAGKRQIPFSRELYIEREDFMEDPPRKFFRLGPGREVRLRYGYWVKCHDFVKDDNGEVTEIHCTYDPETRGGNNPPPDSEGKVRKVKGTLHWVSCQHANDIEVRQYAPLFAEEDLSRLSNNQAEDGQSGEADWMSNINPDSLTVIENAKAEPSLIEAKPGVSYQFERHAYFCLDHEVLPEALRSQASTSDKPVFNRTVTLKDSFKKKK